MTYLCVEVLHDHYIVDGEIFVREGFTLFFWNVNTQTKLSLALTLSLSLSFFLSFSLSDFLSRSLCLSVSLSLSHTCSLLFRLFSLSLSLSLSVSLALSVCLSLLPLFLLHLYFSPSLSLIYVNEISQQVVGARSVQPGTWRAACRTWKRCWPAGRPTVVVCRTSCSPTTSASKCWRHRSSSCMVMWRNALSMQRSSAERTKTCSARLGS